MAGYVDDGLSITGWIARPDGSPVAYLGDFRDPGEPLCGYCHSSAPYAVSGNGLVVGGASGVVVGESRNIINVGRSRRAWPSFAAPRTATC